MVEWESDDGSYTELPDTIVRHSTKTPEEGAAGKAQIRIAVEVVIPRGDIPDSPSLKKVLKIDGVLWSIERIDDESKAMIRFTCIRKPHKEINRDGYRRLV